MGKLREPNTNEELKKKSSEKAIYNIVLASFLKRLIAWLIDQALVLAIVFLLFQLTTGHYQMSIEPSSLNLSILIHIYQLFILTSLVYFTSLEGFSSQTLGKRILGISVYEETGGKVSFTSALFRRIGLLIPIFTFLDGLAILLSSKSQRIFDMIAGTVVIDDDYEQEASLFLEGKDVKKSLKRRGILRESQNLEMNKERKILDKLEEMKSDLEEQFEKGEIEKDRYKDLKRRYESRINQLKKKIESRGENK